MADDDDDVDVFPSVGEAVAAARAEALAGSGTVYLCRGHRAGCMGSREGKDGCAECYRIAPTDRRTVDEHIALYFAGDA